MQFKSRDMQKYFSGPFNIIYGPLKKYRNQRDTFPALWLDVCLFPDNNSESAPISLYGAPQGCQQTLKTLKTLKTTKNGKKPWKNLEKRQKSGKFWKNLEKTLKNDNFKQKCKNDL